MDSLNWGWTVLVEIIYINTSTSPPKKNGKWRLGGFSMCIFSGQHRVRTTEGWYLRTSRAQHGSSTTMAQDSEVRVGWELPGSDIGGANEGSQGWCIFATKWGAIWNPRIQKEITGYRQEFPVMCLFGTGGLCDDSVLNTRHVCWRNLRNNILTLGDVWPQNRLKQKKKQVWVTCLMWNHTGCRSRKLNLLLEELSFRCSSIILQYST